MTPMIDVIFLLLVFFLATSSFQLVEQLLPSGVSQSTEAVGNSEQVPTDPTDDALDQVVIKLEKQGGITVARLNEGPLPDFQQLRDRLLAISLAASDVPVVIDPAQDIAASDVIKAYDWAREAGLARVYLATRE